MSQDQRIPTPNFSDADVVIVRKRSARERHGSDLEQHRASHDALLQVVHNLRDLFVARGLTPKIMTIDELMHSGVPFHKSRHDDGVILGGLQPRQGLVLSVGGDGTLLHTSHFIGGTTRLMGVNAVPKRSVGHLCYAKDNSFNRTVDSILEGKLEPRHVSRLEVQPHTQPPLGVGHGAKDTVSDGVQPLKALPLSLNDVLFCNSHPAASSRYTLRVLQHEPGAESQQPWHPSSWSTACSEQQVSSGLWVSTAAGSTAAISSYGLQRLPMESNKFLLAVREPYFRPDTLSTLTRATLDGGTQSIVIESSMPSAMVAVDGSDFTATLQRGQSVWLSMLPANELLLYI
jgi:NAD+ kinase